MDSSSNPFPLNFKHDVFLSYLHADTGNGFTSHLKSAFEWESFNVAMNDTVDKGEEISDTVLSNISESLVSVVVFSKSYATCAQCLDELVKIWESKEENGGRVVLPVFLGVEPAHVRNQTGAFGDRFQRLIESKQFKEKEETWKSALTKIANLFRWHSMVKGDVPTVVPIVGGRTVAVVGVGLLLLACVGSIFTAICMPQIFRPSAMIPLHVILALCFLFQAWKLHKSNYNKVPQQESYLRLIQSEKFKEKQETWKSALTKTANLSGWDSMVKSEAEIIKAIVECINKTLDQFPSGNYSNNFVGIYQMEEVKLLLQLQSKTNVQFLGIWGMGGIGKTRTSIELFNQISSRFDASCFLENVGQKLESMGLQSLSKELFSQLGIDFKPSLPRSAQRALNGKRVLIILDDVSNSPPLMSFVKNLHYGSGSRIILTCRDKHVLNNYQSEVYEMQTLNGCESLKLFKLHAFKGQLCYELYGALLNKALRYCGGLPLALELLGCHLYDKNFEEWESELAKLENIPNPDVNAVMKISYEELDEYNKRIFLDIACVFCGWNETAVKRILHAHYPNSGIRCLTDKALIINSNGKLRMHDLIQQFGQYMVFSESKEAGNRSRLLRFEDFSHVVARNTGSEKVEVISVYLNKGRRNIHMKPDFFEKMNQLRVLNLYGSRCCGIIDLPDGLSSLPSKLISYLRWDHYPLTSFPGKFPNHLVELQLSHSRLKQLWSEGAEPHLPLLESMDLSFSNDLIKLPNLSKCLNLKTLDVRNCGALVEVPSSIQHLSKLQTLNMDECKNLAKLLVLPQSMVSLRLNGTNIEELPSWIGSLSHLQTLMLSDCSNLTSLPESLGSLQSLKNLWITASGIRNVPSSIGQLDKGLGLVSLQLMSLSCTNIESLPTSIKNLSQLKVLLLEECTNLKSLPDLPSSLDELNANGCTSLTTIGNIFGENDGREFRLNMGGCVNLDQNSRIKCLAIAQARLNAYASEATFDGPCMVDYALLPGSEVPDWFKYKAEGSSIEVELLGGMLFKHLNKLILCVLIDDFSNIMEIYSNPPWVVAHCKCVFVTEFVDHYCDLFCEFNHTCDTGDKHVLLWVEPVHLILSSDRIIQGSPRMMCSKAKFEFHIQYVDNLGYPISPEVKCNIMQCGVSFPRNLETGGERNLKSKRKANMRKRKADMRKLKAEVNLTKERNLKSHLGYFFCFSLLLYLIGVLES